jgi:hypothetical protein
MAALARGVTGFATWRDVSLWGDVPKADAL